MDPQTLAYYSVNAADVASRYESIVNGMSVHFESAFPPGGRVLDVGCGSGRDMALLSSIGRDVYGLDASEQLIAQAQRFHPELVGRIRLGELPSCEVPFDGQFDGILCSAVLMHVPLHMQPAAIDFVRRCLKPGGRFLYSVPTRRDDASAHDHRDAAGRLFIPDASGHLQHLCQSAGFSFVHEWNNSDSLGRDQVEWTSVLMQLSGN